MPPSTPSFSADGLASYFREKIEAIGMVQLSCPLPPNLPSPSAPHAHPYTALPPSSSLKSWLRLMFPLASLEPNPSSLLLDQTYQLLPLLNLQTLPPTPLPLSPPATAGWSPPASNPVLCSNHYPHTPYCPWLNLSILH